MTAPPPGEAPRRAAMLDQAAAANRAALLVVEAVAAARGYRIQEKPGPHMARCIALMLDLGHSGQLGFCDHMLTGGPQPGSWLHWAPTGILCGECAPLAVDVHDAGDAGARCDRCRVPAGRFFVNVHLKPATFDDREEPFVVVPPLLLWVALCQLCQLVEDFDGLGEG